MATYENPVYPRSFPDPFVLKHRGEYWAYCTGGWPDGRRFGVLRSRDLVAWQALGGALAPLRPAAEDWPCYWAPEVAFWDGRFFLYYSVGDEARMEIRVAVADRPEGPFEDLGRRLTAEPFAIDPHPFTAPDGSRWLFYATDFLAGSHVGTGTVADRLLDPATLAGAPRTITRARYDWQVYHPNRPEKGGVRWHTVEGPFVLSRKGLYYQMFSGGNWQNPTYGVSYAVSDTLEASEEWDQAADGLAVLPVLRTLPGRVVGPGHNSVVRGPDNRQLWCVYHRWDVERGERVMAIDPLDWAGERLLVLGPSTGPRAAPELPASTDLFAGPQALSAPCFLAEVSVRAPAGSGPCGIGLRSAGREGGADLQILLTTAGRMVLILSGGDGREERLVLREGLAPAAFHLLRLEVDGPRVALAVDEVPLWHGRRALPAGVATTLLPLGGPEAFAGFAFTLGWEDLFFPEEGDPARLGWEVLSGRWWLTGRGLAGEAGEGPAVIAKGPLFADYELVANLRVLSGAAGGGWGIHPARTEPAAGPLLVLERRETGWTLAVRGAASGRLFPLPADFDPALFQQLRLRKRGGCLSMAWEDHSLGEIEVRPEPARPGFYLEGAAVEIDAVRWTARPL